MPRRTLPAVILLVVAGCGSAGVLPNDPDAVTVYALDPDRLSDPNRDEPPAGEKLHGHRVLGKVDVADPARRREVVAAVNAAVREGGTQARCFNPRHAVRVTRDGAAVDVVICFECGNYRVHRGDDAGPLAAVGSSAKPPLDQLLTDAGVSLAPP